ncbi:hypothetical protein [Actinopolyspora halophila]|nr:hypothetical protein [Actinopolyspora halophila]
MPTTSWITLLAVAFRWPRGEKSRPWSSTETTTKVSSAWWMTCGRTCVR